MAAISAAHPPSAAATALTPPSSGHDDRSWEYDDYQRSEITKHERAAAFDEDAGENHAFDPEHPTYDNGSHLTNGDRSTRSHAVNGNSHWKASDRPQGPTRERSSYSIDHDGSKMKGNHHNDSYSSHTSGRNGASSRRTTADSRHGPIGEDEESKWIHRDKLAQIESQELQAAGFILPKPRSHSRVSRRDNRHHSDQSSLHQKADGPTSEPNGTARSRTNSVAADQPDADVDPETPSWDLRLPDEIAEEGDLGFCVASGLSKGGTRIPVAKLSPAPIPMDYLERPTPVSRKNTSDGASADVDAITYPKPRSRSASSKQADASTPAAPTAKRSATDISPKKPTGARKPSSRAVSAGQRPKTRSGPKDTSRPSTRSGELAAGSTKQPEGDPPWLLSSYRPDPRLPPDQQLLPTVARRLQQEKWEKEGKFGNVLDKEFRPLNDEGFAQPPDKAEQPEEKPEEKPDAREWPLPEESRGTPRPPSVYSTMPKVQEGPANPPPVPMGPDQARPAEAVVRVPEEKEGKAGCACCVVM